MGNCQCLENRNEEEFQNVNVKYSNKTNLRDETVYEDNIKLSADMKETDAGLKVRSHYVYTHNDQNEEVVPTTKGKPELDQSSISSKSNSSIFFDFDEHAKVIFNIYNEIKVNPGHFITKINNFIDNLNNNNTNIPSYIKNYFEKHSSHYKQLGKVRDYLKDINGREMEPTLWSQKAYMALINFISNGDNEIAFKSNISDIIKEAAGHNYICDTFTLHGVFDPEISIMKLLIENEDALDLLLFNAYEEGCAVSMNGRDEEKGETTLYLLRKGNKLMSKKTISMSKEHLRDLNIRDPIFSDLPYIKNIKNGKFEFDGNRLKAVFELFNGEVKEEVYDLE